MRTAVTQERFCGSYLILLKRNTTPLASSRQFLKDTRAVSPEEVLVAAFDTKQRFVEDELPLGNGTHERLP